jgi:hypothetical protein
MNTATISNAIVTAAPAANLGLTNMTLRASPRENYRIYDRTGGGSTHDIYADDLDEAIEAGREWIEGGCWDQDEEELTLDCEVAEILYRPLMPDVAITQADLWEPEWDGEARQWSVDVSDLPEGDPHPSKERVAEILTRKTGGTWSYDSGSDSLVWSPPADAEDEEDEDAMDDAEMHDCSGTLAAKDAPECLDGDCDGHDWRSPYSLLGGCKENPGVWGSGHGSISSSSVCACCGLYRTVDYGATNSSNGTKTTRTTYEDADEASIAWLMRRLKLPISIEINEAEVTLEWDKSADIRQEDEALGTAWHTVASIDLDEGTAAGPCDDQVFEAEGLVFKLGSHEYETDDDGQTTCSASIYRVL